ncbi:hypothetical protein VPH35_101476 [Triticum aestivum]
MRSYMGYEMLLEVWFWDLMLFKLQLPYLVLGIPTDTDDTWSIFSSGSRHIWHHFLVDFVHLLFVSFELEYSMQDLSLNLVKLILYSLNLNNASYLTKFCFVLEVFFPSNSLNDSET